MLKSVAAIVALTVVCFDARSVERRAAASFDRATVTPAAAVSPVAVAGDPTLPRLLVTTVASTPSMGRTLVVAANGKLQAALDSARPGDRIVVTAGATYTGNFTLNAKKTGGIPGGWITVQSSGTIPPEGTRASPVAGGPSVARLTTSNGSPVIAAAPGANRWRLIGLEVTTDPGVRSNNVLVAIGEGNASSASELPRNIILDRMFVHGTANLEIRRCIALNSDSTAVIDSYVSDCHSSGYDSQAVWGWNGYGPFKIVNNYLEASTEIVGFGGADPSIPNLVPSDIEIRGNHLTRPMAWKGGRWMVKNLVEFKAGRRVLIEGNVIENSWNNAQAGWAFVMWSVNQSGRCTWCVLADVTIQKNLIRNVSSGFQLTAKYSTESVPMNRIAIRHNVLVGTDNPAVAGGGIGFLIGGGLAGLSIEHNTMFLPSTSTSALEYTVAANQKLVDHVVRNNLLGGGKYPLFVSPGPHWTDVVAAGADWSGNVFTSPDAAYYSTNYQMPPGNKYPATVDAVGLAGGSAAALSVTATLDQLALSSASPFRGKATDGTDPGANVAWVKAATANAVTQSRVTP